MATILLWLWRHHEDCFQRAFARSGRIDVDHECKWLIHAAVDASVRALTLEVTDPTLKTRSPLMSVLVSLRGKGHVAAKGATASNVEPERSNNLTTKLELVAASIVSKALMAGLSVDEEMVSIVNTV